MSCPHTHFLRVGERARRKEKGNNVVINKITLKYKAKKRGRNKFDTNASTRMTQKRHLPKNPFQSAPKPQFPTDSCPLFTRFYLPPFLHESQSKNGTTLEAKQCKSCCQDMTRRASGMLL